MSNIRVSKRYAKGLYQFAESQNQNKEIYAEMQSLSQLISESKDLRSYLKTPILDYKTKQEIGKELFASYSKTTQSFINLVIQHGREANLKEIAEEYISFSDVKNHVKKAVLISAVELSQELVDKIVKESNLIAKNDTLEIKKQIDPSILGGYIFRVGDQQIDASVKSKFTQLKQEFDDNHYIPKY